MSRRALLDANVLYPVVLRSFLIDLSLLGVFQAHWTDEVQAEWIRNLLLNRPELSGAKLRQTQALMDRALPEARITGYEVLIERLDLPDLDDRHVLAAAIHGHASVIVTQNVKDFPANVLEPYGILAMLPDEFLSGFLLEHEAEFIQAFHAQLGRYRAPPLSVPDLLQRLTQQGAPTIAASLASLLT